MLLLYPFSVLYLLLWLLRRFTARPAQPLPVPVLVVGNHVVGGAGKTPTVITLVQALKAAGRRPGVISRGHGRTGSAPRAVQHMGLVRQAELVVFDERGAGNGFLLPAGPLREPLPAEVPPWMRVLYTAGVASTALPGMLATRRLGLAWPLAAWHAGDASLAQPLASLRGRPLTAAAGLAAPEKFFGMLRAAGLSFKPLPLPDHHAYAQLPWPASTADVVTTEKDAIKLQAARMGATCVWVVPLDLDIPHALVDELLALLPAPAPAAPAAPAAPTPP